MNEPCQTVAAILFGNPIQRLDDQFVDPLAILQCRLKIGNLAFQVFDISSSLQDVLPV